MKGIFVILERKQGGGIIPSTPVKYEKERGEEYLEKIAFYLPQMLPLIEGRVYPEKYPRRTLYSFNSPCGMCDYMGLCFRGDMDGLTFYERKVYPVPYLSPSEIITFEVCPRQWAYNRSGIRKKTTAASICLGDSLHQAIEAYLKVGKPPAAVFAEVWTQYQNEEMVYPAKNTWKTFFEIGVKLADKFPAFWEEFSEIHGILSILSEGKNYRAFPELGFNLTGKPDLVAVTQSETIVVDWKLTTTKYPEEWCRVSDQMTAYFLLCEEENERSSSKCESSEEIQEVPENIHI